MFESAVCDGCRLRPQCVKAEPGWGRSVSLHPQEGLLQEARTLQDCAAFAPYRALRKVAEHRLARLEQLGLRQARYRGCLKTEAHLLLAATVANPARQWAATRETSQSCAPGPDGRPTPHRRVIRSPTRRAATALITKTEAYRRAQQVADPSPPGPSMATVYP